MSLQSIYRLICDGCAKQGPTGISVMEVHAAGYAEGWRYPDKLKQSGQASKVSSDVCGDCFPTWEQQRATNPHEAKS